jgi:hypothetical protein
MDRLVVLRVYRPAGAGLDFPEEVINNTSTRQSKLTSDISIGN